MHNQIPPQFHELLQPPAPHPPPEERVLAGYLQPDLLHPKVHPTPLCMSDSYESSLLEGHHSPRLPDHALYHGELLQRAVKDRKGRGGAVCEARKDPNEEGETVQEETHKGVRREVLA